MPKRRASPGSSIGSVPASRSAARPASPQLAGSSPVRYMPGPSIRHCQRRGSWRGSQVTVTAMPPVGAKDGLASEMLASGGIAVAQAMLVDVLGEAVLRRREAGVVADGALGALVAAHDLGRRAEQASAVRHHGIAQVDVVEDEDGSRREALVDDLVLDVHDRLAHGQP